MIYIEHKSTEPSFWFGLERALMTRETLSDDYFLLWQVKPAVMLGRYQNAQDEADIEYAKQNGIQIARRLTGGGAVYTDLGSFQFSYIKSEQSGQIDFAEFVLPVLSALQKMGFPAQMSGRNDLLIDGKKFCGNAQYRSNGRALHHGTILFDTNFEQMARVLTPQKSDPQKLTAKGVASVRSRVTNLSEYLDGHPYDKAMGSAEFRNLLLSNILPSDAKKQTLSNEEISKIESLHAPLFKSRDWVFDRFQKYEISKSKRFSGGKMELRFNMKNDMISECKILGDFFFAGEIDEVLQKLNGCRFDRDSLKSALSSLFCEQRFYQIGLDELLDCIFD